MKQKILNLEAGYRALLCRLVVSGFQVMDIKPINKSRYIIVLGADKNILITYKRDVFRNFSYKFRELGYKGVVGDTVNTKDLRVAIRNNVTEIYTIFPNAIAYKIPLQEFLENSIKWTTKEGVDVRSIPISALTRAYDLSWVSKLEKLEK